MLYSCAVSLLQGIIRMSDRDLAKIDLIHEGIDPPNRL